MNKENRQKKSLEKRDKSGAAFVVVPIIVIIIAVAVSSYFMRQAIKRAASSGSDAYDQAKQEREAEVYNGIYNDRKEKSEKKYHIRNRVDIDITGIKELSQMEVFRVSDAEYELLGEGDDDYDNVTSWKRIPAEGVFTVDMAACEYVVDNERKYVLLRVPKPVLGDISIDEKNKKTLLYRDDGLFDKNQQYAADLDEKQTNDAKKKLEKKMRGNQEYYTKAEQSAKIVIKNMVEMLNYDIDDLKVEVEFME